MRRNRVKSSIRFIINQLLKLIRDNACFSIKRHGLVWRLVFIPEVPMDSQIVDQRRVPLALYALTAGAFGIGTTEFVIMGLLLQVAADLHVTITAAGLLISGYALGVFVGAPVLTIATRKL